MSTLKIEHIANIANSGPDISIDTSGHLNIVNGSLQMGGTTMLDTSDTTLKNVSKVGIGTATPSSELHMHVTGTANGAQILFDSDYGTGYIGQENNTSNNLIIGSSSAGLTFYASNAQNMMLNSSGNVGIGTGIPQQLLHVNGGAADTTIQITNSASGSAATDGFSLTVENPSGDVNIRNREATNMRFYTSNDEKMRITSAGNVGIGSTSPAVALDVVGDVAITSGTDAKVTINDAIGEVGAGNLAFQASNSAGSALKPMGFRGEDIRFAVSSGEKVRIHSGGNVGIGTDDPGQLLEVNGSGATIRVESTDNNQQGIEFYQTNTKNASIMWGQGSANLEIKNFRNDQNASNLYANIDFFTGGSNATSPNYNPDLVMRLTDDGNVGIGTTAPASKLDVKGDLRITRNVAAGHASEGNWNFNISMESASYYGSLYLVPSVSTGEFSIMGDKLRVTQSSGIQITSDSSNSTSQDNVAIRYNGTAGAHQSGYLFKDKRGQTNAAVKNNLRDDGAGTASSFLEFHTSTGGTLAKAMSIGRYGEVAFDKMPNFATRPYYTNTSLGAGAVVDMYDAHVNVGNHFNGSTNRFTAPYAGNYYFAFHSNIYRPGGAGVIYFDWYKNGSSIVTTYGGRFYGYWTGGWENMMGFVVLPLSTNDYVDLRAGGGGPKVDGGAYGQFIGYALTTP